MLERRVLLSVGLAVLLCVGWPTVSKGQVPCDGVASNVFRTTHIKNSNYSRLVLAARLSRMTYEEAKSHLEGGATVPIYGVPVSGNMSKDDFSTFQERVSKSLDVDQILEHQNELLVSEGDKEIINAWAACIDKFYGISAVLKDLGDTSIRLTLHYTPPPMTSTAPIVQSYTLTGGSIIGGQSIIAKDSREIGINANKFITIKRNGNEPVYFALNTSNVGDASSYLPSRYVYVDVTPPPCTAISIKLISGKFYGGAGDCKPWGWGPDLVCGSGTTPQINKTFDIAASNICDKGYRVYIEAANLLTGRPEDNRPVTVNINGKFIRTGVLNQFSSGAWNKVQKVYVDKTGYGDITAGSNEVVISTNGALPHLRSVQLEPVK